MVSSTKRPQGRQRPLNGRRVLNRQRTRLGLMWDFQNVPLDSDDAYDAWFYMDKFLDIAFPEVDEWRPQGLRLLGNTARRSRTSDTLDVI